MIEGNLYITIVQSYFEFLTSEFDFKMHEVVQRGNVFYSVEYRGSDRAISISYENIEDYFQVIIFLLQDGKLPEYDDKSKTLHLSKINELIIPLIDKDEIDLNNKYFAKFNPINKEEKQFLKAAKELRLCLYHFDKV